MGLYLHVLWVLASVVGAIATVALAGYLVLLAVVLVADRLGRTR